MKKNKILVILLSVLLCGINTFSNSIRTSSIINNLNKGDKNISASSNLKPQALANLPTTEKKPDLPVDKNINIKMSFLGDCMLATTNGNSPAGSFNATAKQKPSTYFFEKAIPFLKADDFTLADCENVFTDSPLSEVEKGYTPAFWFKSEMKNAKIFKDNSIELVTLANNHTMDYGQQGYQDTAKALDNAGVLWTDLNKPVILEKDGIKIGVVSLVLSQYGATATTINQIKELEKTTAVQIVIFHGGEQDIHTPEDWKIKACHALIDCGADLVVGGHPHALQPFETYKGKHIVYSLGNFCYGGSSRPENRTIIYQEVFSFNENHKLINQKENIIPFYVYTGNVNNYQPAPILDSATKGQVLSFMYQKTNQLIIK